MKKLTLPLDKIKGKHCVFTWLLYHVGLVIFFSVVFLVNKGHIGIDADLFNMLPKPTEEGSVKIADEYLTESTAQNVYILFSNEDFAKAKQSAEEAYSKLKNSSNFNSINLYNNLGDLTEVTDFLYKYRWNMLSKESIDLINSEGGAEQFAQEALVQAYSPFTIFPLDNLEKDPFMLTETNMNNLLNVVQNSGIAMSVKDGVMASEQNGKWYVMIRGILSKKGTALGSKKNGVTEIYDICEPLEKDGTKVVYSGTPFGSHENSTKASKEITIISLISLSVAIIILFIVFRGPIPILYSLLSILISILAAILMTLACFHKMHILTLVFGTSLIGSCIDYSLHFFTHWAGNEKLHTGNEIRQHLMPGLSMAIISSCLCFAILLVAPFNLLKQMSVFSLSGLFSSFLTTIAIFPYIPVPKKDRKIYIAKIAVHNDKFNKKFVGRIVISGLFVLSIGTILICHKNLKIQNDVTKLYTIEGERLDDETEANSVIQYSPTGWFIVRGNTEEDALRSEEILRDKLQTLQNSKDVGYLSTSMFIPSIAYQKESRAACEKLLAIAPQQLEALGYDPSYAATLRKEFESTKDDYISIEKGNIPDYLKSLISSAWLGKINDEYFTVILPNTIPDASEFKSLEDNDVFFVNKMVDMGEDLDKLTIMVLKIFLVAYVVMFILLKFFYKLKQALKIISVPILIVLVCAAVFAIANIKLEFFSVTGLILVFGLGLDYIIYMIENEKAVVKETKVLEPFAIMLSFITTVISFGALALSSFKPVHLIGLSIFIGLTTAYISCFFYDRSYMNNDENFDKK